MTMVPSSPSGEPLSTTFGMADVTVRITTAERQAGEMAGEKAARIKELFREHGVVLIDCPCPIVPIEDLEVMGRQLDLQAALALAHGVLDTGMQRGDGSSTRQRPGISTQVRGIHASGLPRHAAWVKPGVVANPIIEQTVAACLGDGAFANTFGTIANFPGSETQVLHMVRPFLSPSLSAPYGAGSRQDGTWWKTTAAEAAAVGHPWPYRAHAAMVSFGCDDVTHENGASEFWPGSHWDTAPATTNKPRDPAGHVAALAAGAERRRGHSPPIQLTCPKGSFYIRDDRCWHRGVGNRADRPRHLITMGYRSAEVRPDLVIGGTMLRNRSTPEELEKAATESGWDDTFVRFHPDCRDALCAEPSRWGVDRNCGFREDVLIPSIDPRLQLDSRGEVVTEAALPPMPEELRGVPWVERVYERGRRARV